VYIIKPGFRQRVCFLFIEPNADNLITPSDHRSKSVGVVIRFIRQLSSQVKELRFQATFSRRCLFVFK
jgi:hypothetical protein